jgi:hypothetical protein
VIHRVALACALGMLTGLGCQTGLPVDIPGLTTSRYTDEEQIANTLDDVHRGMQTRSIYKVLAHVSRSYRDAEGRDYDALQQSLGDFFKRYRDIRITRVPPSVLVHGDRARAVETFGTTAKPMDDRDLELFVQGQVTVYLERVDGRWKILEWSRLH